MHSKLPGRVAGHPNVMASHGGSPVIAGDSVGTAAQVGGGVGGWEVGGQFKGSVFHLIFLLGRREQEGRVGGSRGG